jgi:hypothetical protein
MTVPFVGGTNYPVQGSDSIDERPKFTRRARATRTLHPTLTPARVQRLVQVSRYRGGGGFIWKTPLAGMCGIVEEQLFAVDGSQNSPH